MADTDFGRKVCKCYNLFFYCSLIAFGTGNDFRYNSIHCNGNGAQVVGNNGVLPPVIAAASLLSISGTHPAGAGMEITVSLHDNSLCTSAPCQGKTYLGTTITNASGNWTLNAPFAVPINTGDKVTATATDGNNNTSEFAACVTLTCSALDSLVLVALYNATNGPNWTNNTNWLVPGQSIGTWFGVTVDAQGCVAQIVLFNNQLSGSIPPELGNLDNLTTLQLNNNQLSGSIPPELGNLDNLTSLRLYNNQLSGSIPPELGNLVNLTSLRLGDNQLSGSIPPELGNLVNLTSLRLGSNQLIGSIPPELGDLVNLIDFYLINNQLSGCYPVELLAHCDISYNFTNNPLLPWQGDFTQFCNGEPQIGAPCNDGESLTTNDIILSDCTCQGSCVQSDSLALVALYNATNGSNWTNNTNWLVPGQAIGTWFGVTVNAQGCVAPIVLPINQLSGSIPPELGNLGNLHSLQLYSNQLSGSIPPELGNLGNLQSLQLYSNQLSGSIPPELGNLGNLTELSLSNNQLSGSIPLELGNLGNLIELYLSDNQLSGSIPPELGNLDNLTELFLQNNQHSGSIPPELGNLDNLTLLYLHINLLIGSIPPELGNLDNLTQLILNNNQLSGSIPPELGNLDNLDLLWLSTNSLSGSIPPELGNLDNLEILRLYNNQLSGSIPPELGNLTNVTQFYLQNNQLEGCFPDELNVLCPLGFSANDIVDGYNFTGNPLLPWQGDFTQFCNGDPQIGAPCVNVQTPGSDEILLDCTCGEPCPILTSTLTATPTAICPTASATLTFTPIAGTGTYDVVYSDGVSNFTLTNISPGHTVSVTPTATSTYSLVSVTNGSCTANITGVSVTVTVNPLPTATITPAGATTFCEGGSVVLNASTGAGYAYQWQQNGTNLPGANLSSQIATATGTYTVAVTANGCTATSTAQTVTVTPLPTAAITPTGATAFCEGENLMLNGSTGAGFAWQWQNNGSNIGGATSANYTCTTSGTYTLVVTANACTSTSAGLTVTVFPLPLADAGTDIGACTEVQLDGSNSSAGAGIVYQWTTTGGTVLSGGNTPMPTVTGIGTYLLTVSNVNGCSASDTMAISTGEAPVPNISVSDESCPDEADGSMAVESVSNGTAPYNFSLDGQDFVQDGNFFDLAPGSYTLFVSDAGNCAAQLMFEILESDVDLPEPGIDTFAIKAGQKVQLDAGVNADTYIWNSENNATLSCTGCRNPIASPTRPGGYENKKPYPFLYVVTTIQDGCTYSDTSIVFVSSKFTYSDVLTPNGDGINDKFTVEDLSDLAICPNSELVVFNRWGEIVYRLKPYDNEWEGEDLSNKKLPEGTYYLVVRCDLVEGKIDAGRIVIVREKE